MLRSLIITLLNFLIISCNTPGSIKNYEGNWEGTLSQNNSLIFNITIEDLESNSFYVTIANSNTLISKRVQSTAKQYIQLNVNQDILLNLQYTDGKEELSGFIKSGGLMYHINLKKTSDNSYTGGWKPFMVDSLEPASIYLSFENYDDGTFAAYPFFADQRFRGTYAFDFRNIGDTILFQDFNTGMKFRGKLLENQIHLEILFADAIIASVDLTRSETDWEFGLPNENQNQLINTPSQLNDGWITASIHDYNMEPALLNQLIKDINDSKLENTHSVLIARKGKLVFETYFDGHNVDIPHDMRSASKSISSAMIGIAIDDKIIEDTDLKLYDCIPDEFQYTKDAQKSNISIRHLLTMSSGLDVSDRASEDNYQGSENWLKTVLEAPMKNDPGTYTDYGSANPFLLGVCLNEQLDKPLEIYMDEKLFSPLGISNYIINTEDTQTTPYFGGGMLLTSRDMLKFGQLYLDKGTWKGKKIISEEWVNESFKKHTRLEDVVQKNEYGYQWWHNTYIFNGEEIESIEARGAGGQYICVIPELELVVVITSGNYRNRNLLQQPQKILADYILPAITK